MDREEFKQFILTKFSSSWSERNLQPGCPIWIPEEREQRESNFFVECYTNCSQFTHQENQKFWDWSEQNLSHTPLCYMINNDRKIEWWGFDNEKDMMMFLLRWARTKGTELLLI